MTQDATLRQDSAPDAAGLAPVEVATRLYEAFNRGDIATVLALFHPAIEFREAEGNPYRPDGTPWIGPDQVLAELFVRIGEDWDNFGLHDIRLTETATGVVAEGRYRGTFKATGRTLDAQVAHVLRVRDGVLTHFQQYADTAALQWAMGVASPSGEGHVRKAAH